MSVKHLPTEDQASSTRQVNSTTATTIKMSAFSVPRRVVRSRQHLRALREQADRAGGVIVETYTDNAVSGSREKRPGLDALMAEARRRRVDRIAVAALDRLGRNLRHRVTLLDELQHRGVGLASRRAALDLTSPIGTAIFALVGVLADVARAWIVERAHAGLRRTCAQGKRLGRPRVITNARKLRQ